MKILSLTLVGYHGFRLRQIKSFVYRPTKKTQIVLGTNGSGKSSLLRELSPLPGNPSDYEVGGKKEIEISHQGRHYRLSSLFEKDGNLFLFEMDGESLNPGRTVTVYRELVKQHFGYTPEIRALMTGETRFSAMSVAERRNWFMRIADMDYTYAVGYYQRLKEKARDLQGALKQNQLQQAQAAVKCLNEAEEQKLRASISVLRTHLDVLLSHRRPRHLAIESEIQTIESSAMALESYTARLERLLSSLEGTSIPSEKKALESMLLRSTVTEQHARVAIVERCKKIDGLQKDLKTAQEASHANLAATQAKIQTLEAEEATLRAGLRYPITFQDPEGAHQSFKLIKDDLYTLVDTLMQRRFLHYPEAQYKTLLREIPRLEAELTQAKPIEHALRVKLGALQKEKEKLYLTCPNCQHTWHPSYHPQEEVEVTARLTTLLEKIASEEKRLTALQEEKAEAEHLYQLLNRYASLTERMQWLAPFWAWIQEEGGLLANLEKVKHGLGRLSLDLQDHRKLAALRKEIEEARRLLSIIHDAKTLDLDKLTQALQEEEATVQRYQAQCQAESARIALVKASLATLNEMETLCQKVDGLIQEKDRAYQTVIEDQLMAVVDEIIRSIRLKLSIDEATLSQISLQQALLTSLKENEQRLKTEHELMKHAIKALSPAEGLIAQGMTRFINHFVAEINRFIEQIWLYPLSLVPITLSEDDSLDLDYRFLVEVNHDHRAGDVSRTSTGMKEVIDLAFVAVSMKYLGMTQYPIFLDEFAVRLDVAHRQSAYQAIDLLIDSSDYSQVFLVSHYQDGYSSLHASEVLVLCDSNIALPDHLAVNQHVTMTT